MLLPDFLDFDAIKTALPGGSKRNFDDVADDVRWADAVPEPLRRLLCDAQTSGGLLIAVAPDRAQGLLAELRDAGLTAAEIGWLYEGPPGTITVEP